MLFSSVMQFQKKSRPQFGVSDDERIRLEHDYEQAYWATRLGVSTERLLRAAGKVGTQLGKLKRELGREQAE